MSETDYEIDLSKPGPQPLMTRRRVTPTRVRFILEWREAQKAKQGRIAKMAAAATGGNKIDLDATCICVNPDRRAISAAFEGDMEPFGVGVIKHHGDARGGKKASAEIIDVDLTKVPKQVQALVFALTSNDGKPFNKVNQLVIRLIDMETEEELVVLYVPIDVVDQTNCAALMVEVRRIDDPQNPWTIDEVNMLGNATNWQELGALYRNHTVAG